MSEITYIGHATTVIDLGGERFMTDPMLASRLGHIRRVVEAPAESQLERLAAVLVSHAHLDHLHLPSLRRVAKDCPVVVPRGCGRLVRRAGVREVVELDAGERVHVGTTEITATPALHDGRRWPVSRQTPSLGFLLEGTASVYFAGDTDLFDAMRDLRGKVDVALLPVAGWGALLPPGHLNPETAARAAELVEPRVAVPIHWGTLATAALLRLGSLDKAPQEFARFAGDIASEVEVRILQPGEFFEF